MHALCPETCCQPAFLLQLPTFLMAHLSDRRSHCCRFHSFPPPPTHQEVLWEKLGEAVAALAGGAGAAWHVQRVLAKKRDALSQVLFLDVVAADGAPLPVDAFWCAFRQFDGWMRHFGDMNWLPPIVCFGSYATFGQTFGSGELAPGHQSLIGCL